MPTAPRLPPLKPTAATAPRRTTEERGYGTAHRQLRARLIALHPVCQRCQDGWSAHMHHVNSDSFDRSPTNLQMVCVPCHQQIHAGR
jgi:5-methylcytosine-specific restriction endonuclease McrA